MPTNLATLYALQNKTNPKREQAKMLAEGIKTIEPDKYGYSSIAKIPLMYMYGKAAGEASNTDAERNEEISGLMKSTVENEQLKAKNEGLKTQSTLDKNRVDMTAKVLETAMKMADTIDDDGAAATSYLNQNKETFGLADDISISKVKKTGQHALIGLFNKNDNSESLFNFDTKNGKLFKVGKDNQWEEATPDDLTTFSKTAAKPNKAIERTVDLGDKVEYIYTDGTKEVKSKGKLPSDNAITPQERAYKQNLDQYRKLLTPLAKADDKEGIRNLNAQFQNILEAHHIYNPIDGPQKKEWYEKWADSISNFFSTSDDVAQPTKGSPAEAYAKGGQKKPVTTQPKATQPNNNVSKDTKGRTVYKWSDGRWHTTLESR